MDLKRLEYFLLVADHGSFSRAASIIGVSQPALGRQVQRLEKDCGARLLYRHGRGVSLTPEGLDFADRIRPLIRDLALAMEGPAAAQRPLSGEITIGMTPTLMSLMGLHLLQKLREVHPGIKLNFLTGYSGYVHEWLVDGRLDIAILHDARRSRHIAVDFLASARLFLVSHPDAAAAEGFISGASVPARSLARLSLALPSRTHGLRRTLEAVASKLGIALRVDYELDTLELLKDVALAGVAHTVLALPAVAGEVMSGSLKAVALRSPPVETRLMVATSLNRPQTQAGRAVLEAIRPVLVSSIERSPIPLHMAVAQAR
ncbi:LysR family transcriptional regulator [Candidimonas nitroreducens]|uniref:LysR family transcriptional regulator n=1 Tax=Candidimonas nitroreducens TaxID=683354 RepID=A0A225M7M5_9BURK|nr:LysR family transcriptional regulator [Candidimonas nitroreducens]OWT56243.1 LysR family transcriptional regulator [Candidimonas nitroreducens]